MSSNKLLLAIFFVVMVGLIGGIIYMSLTSKKTQLAQTVKTNPSSNTITQISPKPITQTSINDTQLEKDSQTIDDSLNSLDNELTNVDNGLNDQAASLQ